MTLSRQLFELQELDTQTDGCRSRLAQIEGQLGESQALKSLKERMDGQRSELSQLNRDQKALELDSQGLQGKSIKLEQSLYRGGVTSLKELAGLQGDLEQTRRQQREKEDQILALMERAEGLESDVRKGTEEYKRLEAQWENEQEALKKGRGEVVAELAVLEGRRTQLTQGLERSSHTLYEGLRASHQGQAVAKVEGGMCRGCRISLPTTQVQKARMGAALVQCNSCGRILYVS